MTTAKGAVIYSIVSTHTPTAEDQLTLLRSYARLAGCEILAELSDRAGVATGKDQRPGFKALRVLVARKQVAIVVGYSVECVSRSPADLLTFLQTLRRSGVDLILLRQGFDTSCSGAMDLVAVLADLEKVTAREKILAGLERVRASGQRLGRPSRASDPSVLAEVRALNAEGMSIHKIAKELRIGVQTTQRLLVA